MEHTDDARWENYLGNLTSRDRYDRWVKRYFAWCSEVGKDAKDPFVAEAYITDAHERFLTNPGVQNSLCGKTCWSVMSMIGAYFQNVWLVDITKQNPLIVGTDPCSLSRPPSTRQNDVWHICRTCPLKWDSQDSSPSGIRQYAFLVLENNPKKNLCWKISILCHN